MTLDQLRRWVDLRRIGLRWLGRAGDWLRRVARSVQRSSTGRRDWLPRDAERHRVGDHEIGIVGPEPPLPALSEEELARLSRFSELQLDPASFPVDTYLEATAPWRTASSQWIHRVKVDREPARLLVAARHPEVEPPASEPSTLLVYGQPTRALRDSS